MSTPTFDITPFLSQDEGQFFERKSLFEGEEGKKRPRNRRTVRDEVAEVVAAFANAEGGILILGIEDDGEITGHKLPADVVRTILDVPRTRLSPSGSAGFRYQQDDHELLVFEVAASDVPVHIEGNGFPLRMGDKTVQATESKIAALKVRGFGESWEAGHSRLSVGDLDEKLLERARGGAGLRALSVDDYLLRRKLADRRGAKLILRKAAELLFATQGPDHANAGVRVFRVIGTERRTGVEHNVEERPRIEGNLAAVLDQTFASIPSLIRRPSRLRGSRFVEQPEYPDFVWKEAILNAIAHRDYAIEGFGTEAWFFDDRLEVKSPGGLLQDVTIEALLRGERTHVSRNPRLVRALVDLGFMRDQGEGIPRMFAEMETSFLAAPDLRVGPRDLTVTLRNTLVLTDSDRELLARVGEADLTNEEFRAVLEASRHGRVDNSRMRTVTGLDTLAASKLLRRLRDRNLLVLHSAGAESYYELGPRATGGSEPDRPDMGPDRGELAADRGELGVPAHLRALVDNLGTRPRKQQLRMVVEALCAWRSQSAAELAATLETSAEKLTERHLGPMVADGRLVRAFPDKPNHPQQKYRARAMSLPLTFKDGED